MEDPTPTPPDEPNSARPILNYSPPTPSKKGSEVVFFIGGFAVGVPVMIIVGVAISVPTYSTISYHSTALYVAGSFGLFAVACGFGVIRYLRTPHRRMFLAGFLMGVLLVSLLCGACFFAAG